MNPEQASKVKSWMPTPLNLGEGRRAIAAQPSKAIVVRRGIGDGMSGKLSAQRERPRRSEGRALEGPSWGSIGWESEGPVVPLMPGKPGGGKEPCFRNASEATEDRRLA